MHGVTDCGCFWPRWGEAVQDLGGRPRGRTPGGRRGRFLAGLSSCGLPDQPGHHGSGAAVACLVLADLLQLEPGVFGTYGKKDINESY